MLMTLAGLASKLMMINLYDTVHKNYQMVRMSYESLDVAIIIVFDHLKNMA